MPDEALAPPLAGRQRLFVHRYGQVKSREKATVDTTIANDAWYNDNYQQWSENHNNINNH